MQTEKNDELWTERELAERWNVKRQSLAAMRCRGDGVAFTRIGRLIRYRKSAVIEYEQRRTGTSTTAVNAALAA